MQSTPTDWLNILKPNFKILPFRERLLCGLGAFVGLLISSLISWWILDGFNAWYIAPMGASSVLLFYGTGQSLGTTLECRGRKYAGGLYGCDCGIIDD